MSQSEAEKKGQISRRMFLTSVGLGITAGALGGYSVQRFKSPQLNVQVFQKPEFENDQFQQENSSAIQIVNQPEPNFGVRNDVPEYMSEAVDLGASLVRIEGQAGDVKSNPKLLAKLNSARANNLKIIYIYNPTNPIDRPTASNLLGQVVHIYSNIIEVGNEVDNAEAPFWPDFYTQFHESGGEIIDFESFADHASTTIEAIRYLDKVRHVAKPTKIIMGALANVDYAVLYKEILEKVNIDLTDPNLFFAVHAYNTVRDIKERVNILLNAGYPASRLIFTEIGVRGKDKPELPEMLRMAYFLTKNPVIFHELHTLNNANEPDTGLVGPEGRTLAYKKLQDTIRSRYLYRN